MILWGPPGSGKTTIARLLADATQLEFEQLSAIFSGVQDLRKAFDRAKARQDESTVHVDTWDEFVAAFADGKSSFVYAHWDGTAETETAIKAETKATIRCIPYPGEGPDPEPGTCIKTGKPSAQRVLFAKNY